MKNNKHKHNTLLSIVNPELFSQIINKNKNIDLEKITFGSNIKLWWKCEKDHEWPASVNDRQSKQSGCPYCMNQKVCIDNCLQTINPTLASEWHPTMNSGLTPYDVVFQSLRKVWWKCEKGHKWRTRISNRVCKNSGCPKCNRNSVSNVERKFYYFLKLIFQNCENTYELIDNGKKNEIDIFIPEINLAIEYDGIYYHNNDKKIKKDINKNNILKKHNIPLIRIRETGLPKIHTVEFSYNYGKKKAFENTFYNILTYIVKNFKLTKEQKIKLKKTKNIDIEKYIIPKGFFDYPLNKNSLIITHPNIAKEWHPHLNGDLKPEHISHGSVVKVFWLCEKGHKWKCTPNNRTSSYNNSGCPTCYELYKRNIQKIKSVKQIDIKTNKCISIYKSMSDASRQTGVAMSLISGVCNDKFKQSNGFRWEFVI